jgi:serine/threonine protein kinase
MHCPLCHTDNPDGATLCRACGVALDSQSSIAEEVLPIGTLLQQGAYVIDRVLGQGGFGITYLASDVRLNRAVAIKEFFPTGCYRKETTVQAAVTAARSDFQDAKQRFLEEARTLARFRHPGIVDVFAAFEENNTAYMVMEYLLGKTLGNLVHEQGSLDEDKALRYICEAGQALEVVHQAGTLHRDIKPDNLMLCHDGRVVLIDFGTARDFSMGRTQGHTVVVTPGYAPLEQYAQKAQRGAYSDVYALGATLYFSLSGEAPVPATDRAAGVEFEPSHRLMPSVSYYVGEAIRWAMDMKVERRPATVKLFIDSLELNSETSRPHETGNVVDTAGSNSSIRTEESSTTITPHDSQQAPISVENTVWLYGSPREDIGLHIKWPQVCPCCGCVPDSSLDIFVEPNYVEFSGTRRWRIPYCSDCIRHIEIAQKRGRQALSRTNIGFGTSLLAASGLSIVVSNPVPILLWLAGFGIIRPWSQDFVEKERWAATKATCTTPQVAVTCTNGWRKGDGSYAYCFAFENSVYQRLFEEFNGPAQLTS